MSFRAGRNSLLVKASVETGEWGFNLMLVDPEGELEVSTDPAPTGKPDLSF